jgi:hypothetical protein
VGDWSPPPRRVIFCSSSVMRCEIPFISLSALSAWVLVSSVALPRFFISVWTCSANDFTSSVAFLKSAVRFFSSSSGGGAPVLSAMSFILKV